MDFTAKYDHQTACDYNKTFDFASILKEFEITAYEHVKPLSGGYRNLNYKITRRDSPPVVLRLSANPQVQFEAEIAVLKRLVDLVPVPRILQHKTHILAEPTYHAILLEYVPGIRLCDIEDHLKPASLESVATQLGGTLATIHAQTFEDSGFFGRDLSLSKPFTSFYDGYYGHLEKCLQSERLISRLPSDLLNDLKRFVHRQAPIIAHLTQVTALVHSDFNQKNILVADSRNGWQVSAILDWEFAFSGSPLVDLGNFFRFGNEMPVGYEEPLIRAYQNQGGVITSDWKQTAKTLDLLSMVLFLMRDGEYPKTFATAEAVIASTLLFCSQ